MLMKLIEQKMMEQLNKTEQMKRIGRIQYGDMPSDFADLNFS